MGIFSERPAERTTNPAREKAQNLTVHMRGVPPFVSGAAVRER
jgi:hypothetical protein